MNKLRKCKSGSCHTRYRVCGWMQRYRSRYKANRNHRLGKWGEIRDVRQEFSTRLITFSWFLVHRRRPRSIIIGGKYHGSLSFSSQAGFPCLLFSYKFDMFVFLNCMKNIDYWLHDQRLFETEVNSNTKLSRKFETSTKPHLCWII